MRQIVIDASVVIKWYLRDEELGQKAMDLLNKYISKDLDFLAPSLLEYEVINGLRVAQKRGRIKKETIFSAVDGFMNLDVQSKNLSNLYSDVLHYCNIYNCSAYDAGYLAVAHSTSAPFITADERLYNMVKKDLNWVKWLGDVE